MTILAIASASSYNNSPVAGGTYTVAAPLPAPAFSPAGGTYSTSQTVTISDATAGTTIYYTTNGTTPSTTSTPYTGSITVGVSETLEAIAVESGYSNSPVASAAYTIGSGSTTYISYPSGGFTATNLSLNNGPTVTAGMLQVTNAPGQQRSAWFATPVPVGSFINDFTFQQLNASADGMTFAIQNNNIWSLGYSGGGLGYQSIPNSVAIKFDLYNNAGEGSDSTGLYTGGAAPTVPSVDLSSTGINLHSSDLMHAHMVYDGINLTMTLTDTVTNASVTKVFPVNIPSAVGGNAAYVGFTGGTGGSGATQNILSWSFVSPAGQFAAAPTFSPAAGAYTGVQSVTIADATPGATIYYTTNGTTPTTSSTVYSGPITVSSSETLEAIAAATGDTNSAVATAAYTISAGTLPAPTFSPAAGTYTTAQTVTISDTTTGTTIYYTTNGTTPTTSSAVYSAPITVSASETLEAIAVKTGYTNSAVGISSYTIAPVLPAPTFSPASGTYTTAQTVAISDTTTGTTIYYTTNGTTPTTASTVYSAPITVSASETLEAIAVKTGSTNSVVATAAYTISTVLPTPTFSPAAGTYTTAQSVTISDTTAGTTIYYTTNGTTPTTSSTTYSAPITVSASETLEAIAVKTGSTNSLAGTAVYTISPVLPAPTFSPVAGTYTTAQTVTISDTTAGTTIYYTTNGTTPTTSSTVYSAPITVSASETLEAIAVKTGSTNSAVATAVYTIAPVLPTPTFSPAAGTYTTAQTVSISDATAGTTIYYTTNGTTPTTSSTVYSAPITVSSSETLEAIAVKTGSTNSAIATAAYTISSVLPTPTFSPAAGTYTTTQTVTISDTTTGTTIYYTTNGTTPTTSSAVYSAPITVSASETLEAIAVKTGFTNSAAATAVYTINPVLPAPTFSPAAGTYTTAQTVAISDATTGTTIYYTTNGTTPTTASTVYSASITVSASETLEAIAVKAGSTNSVVATAAYTISTVLPTPTFSPAAGTYTTAQSVTISDTTDGTTIYYTTNGTTPTTSSTVYSAPITVSASGNAGSNCREDWLDQQRRSNGRLHHRPCIAHAHILTSGWNLHHCADGHHQRYDHRHDHLLHHQRDDSDHFIDQVHCRDHGGGIGDAGGHRRQDRLYQQLGGHRRLYHHAGLTRAHILAGCRNLFRNAVRDDQRCDGWNHHLLHHERNNAHHLIERLQRSDPGECNRNHRSDGCRNRLHQ